MFRARYAVVAAVLLILVVVLVPWCPKPPPTDRAIEVRMALRATRDSLRSAQDAMDAVRIRMDSATTALAASLAENAALRRLRRAQPLPPAPSPTDTSCAALPAWRARAQALEPRLTACEVQVDSLLAQGARSQHLFAALRDTTAHALARLRSAETDLKAATDRSKKLEADVAYWRHRAQQVGLGVAVGGAAVQASSTCLGPGAVAGVRIRRLGPVGVVVGYGAAYCGGRVEHGPGISVGLAT